VFVLVEGLSDRVAIETIAARRGLDLVAAGVQIVAIGGAGNAAAAVTRISAVEPGAVIALCDRGEEPQFRRAGLGPNLFVCDADLEDELIRAMGPAAVEAILASQGELDSFRTFQKQPAQRDRPVEAQLHRFMGTRSGRKFRYAALLAGAVDAERIPAPLDQVLAASTYSRTVCDSAG